VLVMISNMSAPICNRFHANKPIMAKLRLLEGTPLTPSFEQNPLAQGHQILSQKNRVLGAAHVIDYVILACIVLIEIQSVMDGQTDRQTDTQAKTCEALHAIAHKKLPYYYPFT